MSFRPAALWLAAVVVIVGPARAETPMKFRVGPAEDIQEPGKSNVSLEAQELSKKAMRRFGVGDFAGAKKAFQQVLALAPGNVPVTINLALIEYREKRHAEAEALLQSAAREAPDSGLPWLVLGVVQYDQGPEKYEAALASLARAVMLEPKDARAHHYLGVLIGSKGWYLGAEDEMRKAIELQPDYAEAHYNLAAFYLQRNPPAVELARRHYIKSIDLGGAPDPAVEAKVKVP